MLVCLRLVLLGACLIARPEAVDVVPGLREGLTVPDDGTRYDVFVPKVYTDETESRHPLVLMSGELHVDGLKSWAERQAVLLVRMHFDMHDTDARAQKRVDAVLEALAAGYRIEPALRFGFSTKWSLTNILSRTDSAWGGLLSDDLVAKPAHKHVCLALIERPLSAEGYGPDAGFWPRETMTGWGNPHRVVVIPTMDAGWKLADEAVPLLDWMLLWQRLSHPELPLALRKTNLDRVRDRIAALKAHADPAVRRAESDALLQIDCIATSKEGPGLAATWCAAALAVAQAETDAIRRSRALDAIATHERAKAMLAADRKVLQAALAELRKDKAVRADSESRAATAMIAKIEIEYATRPRSDRQALLRKAIEGYEGIAKRWPDTEAATAAKASIARLEKDLQ